MEATAKQMGSGIDQIPKEGAPAAPVPTARLFFALWPDDLGRADLARAIHEAARSCGGRPVPEHNLHATLVFLGSVAVNRLPESRTIGTQVASSNAGAPLRLEALPASRDHCPQGWKADPGAGDAGGQSRF